jgi:hypothetical protein
VVSVAAYLTAVRVTLDSRNHRTWEHLAAQLNPGSGRRAAFHNAGVLLEMVDYACHADNPIDVSLAEVLRAEAMRVRLGAVLAPTPWS